MRNLILGTVCVVFLAGCQEMVPVSDSEREVISIVCAKDVSEDERLVALQEYAEAREIEVPNVPLMDSPERALYCAFRG